MPHYPFRMFGRAVLTVLVMLCVLAAGSGAARAQGTYTTRAWSCANGTAVTGAPFPSQYNFQSIFNSLPTSAPGYGSASFTAWTGLSNQTLIGGLNGDYASMATFTFEVGKADLYSFRAGGDYGYGAVLMVDGAILQQRFPSAQCADDADMWWNYSFSEARQFLFGSIPLAPGTHSVTVYGFESCCDGTGQLEFMTGSVPDWRIAAIDTLSPDAPPPVPEPASTLLLGFGLAGMGWVRGSRRLARGRGTEGRRTPPHDPIKGWALGLR